MKICKVCGYPVDPALQLNYHRTCYVSQKRKQQAAKLGRIPVEEKMWEWWNDPLPDRGDGIFDYDKYFEQENLAGYNRSSTEPVHHIPVFKSQKIA